MKTININDLIAKEVERLTIKYNKEYFNCDDLIKIMGIGRDNVRQLMRSECFPTIKVGKRIIISVFNFVTWEFANGYLEV